MALNWPALQFLCEKRLRDLSGQRSLERLSLVVLVRRGGGYLQRHRALDPSEQVIALKAATLVNSTE